VYKHKNDDLDVLADRFRSMSSTQCRSTA